MSKARDYQTEYPLLEKTLEIIVNAISNRKLISCFPSYLFQILFHRKNYSIIPLEPSTKSYARKGAELTRTSVVYISKLLLAE